MLAISYALSEKSIQRILRTTILLDKETQINLVSEQEITMKEYQYITLREQPERKEMAAKPGGILYS